MYWYVAHTVAGSHGMVVKRKMRREKDRRQAKKEKKKETPPRTAAAAHNTTRRARAERNFAPPHGYTCGEGALPRGFR